jgi:hypothetical protein
VHSPPQVSPRFADATRAHRQPACDVSGDPHTARSTPTANVSYRPHAAYACHTGSGLFGRFGDGSASRVRSDVREGTARIRAETAVHAIVVGCEAREKWFRALLNSPNLKRR